MITIKNNLKYYRERANIPLQDVAVLLKIPPSNLIRYENGQRNPTPEIILTYHILFGAKLTDLFSLLVKEVKHNLVQRSQGLIEQLATIPAPKSSKRLSYLMEIVKFLKEEKYGG
jgi:transcriptional regulator with XRE-family HTH domain